MTSSAVIGSAVVGTDVLGTGIANPYVATSGNVEWIVQVDWDQDGVWGGDIEPQTILDVRFTRGRRSRIRADGKGQEHPEREKVWIEILDNAQRYDSFNTSYHQFSNS